MNHCVPDFEMEDDYSILSSSTLTRSTKPSRPEGEIMELLWQNGQVVMQSQNQRSFKKSPAFKFHEADQSAPREIRSSSSSSSHQQQSVTDHLFMQEDEMASWLHYPLSDVNFDHDFCADLLYPSSSAFAPAVAPYFTSTDTTSAPPTVGRVSQVSASAMASAPRPPVPPARRNELDSTRIQNFSHFSRHKTARAEEPGPSNSKSVILRESTVVDSSDTPAMAPESGASQATRSNTEAPSCRNKNNANASMSAATVTNTQSAAVSVDASKDNLATCEVTVTSSPGASSASAEPTAQRATTAEDRKRKGREMDDPAECYSEDAEFESADTKKQTRGSTSTKRSRAAEVHNLSERRRRDRINEKMRALQELIPCCNKSDKASMLDEAIEYLKSLQLQVQMMSMGCGMFPMMFPGVQQYMPPMGMGIGMGMGMGMDMGIIRPMIPFPNVLAGSALPTPTTAAAPHLSPRFPMSAFHMPPPVPAPAPDPSKIQPSNQSDAMLNPLGMQNLNPPPRIPNFADPYQQYFGLHQIPIPPPQSQAMAQPSSSKPSTSRGDENIENHPSGDMTR